MSDGTERSMITSTRVKTLVMCCLILDNIRWRFVSSLVMLFQVIGTLKGFSTTVHHALETLPLTVDRFLMTL